MSARIVAEEFASADWQLEIYGGYIMAKKENREGVALQCTICKENNYLTSKNKKNSEGKLEMKKYCPRCNKTTLHKERKA